MTKGHETYTASFKNNVLQEYRRGIHGCGFKSLAKGCKIKGGHTLIAQWYRQWDGTIGSLERKSGGGRPRSMTKQEVTRYILNFVKRKNRQYKPVDYRTVQSHIDTSLHRKVPLSTIQRYGRKECGIKSKQTNELIPRDLDPGYWMEIANFRRLLQRIGNDRLIFFDETAVYYTMYPRRTLVAPGQQALIIVDKPSAYASRYDLTGAINGSQPIACMVLTPDDRKEKDIKGVRKHIVNEWILKKLAPAINRLAIDNVYLICDKSRAHNKLDMMQAFKDANCPPVIGIHYVSTASSKYISPLDNPIWHSLKETHRGLYPITAIDATLSDTFEPGLLNCDL
ncbi:unnamed protein product [Didymodactylos carnosus]|uniref:Uncharacterized protein n=1 Tax=Didymodactylos carnosus TaxID=1234261 RepID=A0A814FNG5_9BILA|nr:unnamed protein product [Didymodactylos carnosus]CAF3757429.1 unnamed protein product [Didymodactylos carnosus]